MRPDDDGGGPEPAGCWEPDIDPPHEPEVPVTASTVKPETAAPRGPGGIAAGIIALTGGIAVLVLLVVGLTFFGLAIAFPIALPVAQAYHVPISAADAAIAERFAPLWWAFLAVAIATFAAAGVIVVKLVSVLSPTAKD
jgi:hypothetical protein